MEYQEFIKEIKKVKGKRKHNVNNSYGTKSAFFYYRKIRPQEHKYVLTDLEYMHIIRAINNRLRDFLIEGKDIHLPEKMGQLEVRKRQNSISFKDGKMHTTLPVNWEATLKLWHEDPECYATRTLVREEDRETFKVYYNKNKANYNNKSFYQFSTNREIKIGLKNNIKLNKLDAFKYGK